MIKTEIYYSRKYALIYRDFTQQLLGTEITVLRNLNKTSEYYIGKIKKKTLNEFIFDDGTILQRNIFTKVLN